MVNRKRIRMPTDSKTVISITLLLVIVATVIFAGTELGFSATMQTDLISLIPGISIFIVGALIVAYVGASNFAIAAFGVMGLGLAILVDEMNTTTILIPDILTATFTLEDLQVLVLVIFLLVGAITAAMGSNRSY